MAILLGYRDGTVEQFLVTPELIKEHGINRDTYDVAVTFDETTNEALVKIMRQYPDSFVFNGDVLEYRGEPVTFELPSTTRTAQSNLDGDNDLNIFSIDEGDSWAVLLVVIAQLNDLRAIVRDRL